MFWKCLGSASRAVAGADAVDARVQQRASIAPSLIGPRGAVDCPTLLRPAAVQVLEP